MRTKLSPQVFAILAHFVEERVGLHYRPEDAEIFSAKVLERMSEAGFESPLDYYYRLRYDEDRIELTALVDALVVGETYFFREAEALRAAIEHVVRPAIAERGTARIWSAACATGEEPLTLAMLLADAGLLDRCVIRASDISARALDRARAGRYWKRSFRVIDTTPEVSRIAEPFFTIDGDTAVVTPSLRSRIEYRPANLLDTLPAEDAATFDLVLCRNVLIYFSDENVLRVVRELARSLRPEGRLLVGTSESLLRFSTSLRCEERRGSFFYARAGA